MRKLLATNVAYPNHTSVFLVTFLDLLALAMAYSSSTNIIQVFTPHEVSLSLWVALLALLLATLYLITITMTWPRKHAYLVDFACFKPDPASMCTKEKTMEILKSTGKFKDESLDFIRKVMEKSGLGDKTYVSEPFLKIPPRINCLDEARKEAESVIFGAIDDLLLKTKLKAEEIGILVTNCSLFNPTPSLSAMVVNRYKLKHNIVSYNLSGMGCGAGPIALDLAKRLLQVHANCYALVVSTENTTVGAYFGNNRTMLISNSLFRVGGAAILLSNLPSDSLCSKYLVKHIVRTHKGSLDDCYNCITQEEDEQNIIGITLSTNIFISATEAVKANISSLGKYVLPISEQLKFLANLIAIKLFKNSVKSYIPDFKLAFEHFCIHTGAKSMQNTLQKVLSLSDWHMEPSRMTLYKFGNTSTSSVWYGLAYCEAQRRVKKGDRICQIALGSGFKCNSVVLHALRTIDPTNDKNPWMNEIHEFPAVAIDPAYTHEIPEFPDVATN